MEHRLEADEGFRTLRPEDRRLAQELVFGVLRRQGTLDWLIQRRTGGRRQHPDIRRLLHLGLYQIFYLDRIPPHAAVHETVQLARGMGLSPQTGFLNAVLRETLRELPAIRESLVALRETDPATAFSHPAWLLDQWRKRLTPEELVTLMDQNNLPPSPYARVNSLRTDAAALRQHWATEGVVAEERTFPWATGETLFELKSHPSLATLPSFQRGDFYIQDPSTVMAVTLLDPQPGESVLDTCAAPGGKTTLIAARLGNRGTVRAEDTSAGRRALLTENVVRLGATCVTVSAPPGVEAGAGSSEIFDRVLVDAPCSNTGVLRRRVELRWRLKPETLGELHEAQGHILRAGSRRVRPGGILVYSTCSLEPEENAEVVAEFTRAEPGFVLESTREVLPWRDGVDGAYAARLRRLG